MILHIISEQDWEKAQTEGLHSPSSLDDEGFIHCSTKEQVNWVANSFFKGHADLLLLCIDDERVKAKIVFEDTSDTGMLFPHIYGPLNLDAVIRVMTFKPSMDGTFEIAKEFNEE